MIWALRWSVALRTFYRQILSLLYSSFPFGNFRPRLVRALLVYIYIYICNAYAEGFNHSDRQENQILFYVGVTTHDISFVTDLLQKSSRKLHPRSLVRARSPYAKELADTKKELTEKHEMLEKTTMLGIKNWSIGTFWVEVFCR